MSAILAEICQWARQQPAWEQEALRRILAREVFDEPAYAALAELLIEGKGAKPVDLTIYEIPPNQASGPKPVLRSISEMTNVNALVDGETIEFGPAATAIYGRNGSGKSGYARVFGSACFTRGDREVLPNVFDSGAEVRPQHARIIISRDGEPHSLEYTFGDPVAELAGFYVFDTTCVATHLQKPNSLTFAPIGLSALQELVQHTDKVREMLYARVEAATKPHDFAQLFDSPTIVSRHIAELSAKTDLAALQRLATLSAEDTSFAEALDREIAALKVLDVQKAVRAMRQEIELARRLSLSLREIESQVNDQRLGDLRELLRERKVRQEASDKAGADQFAVEGLHAVGSGAWSEFIHTAKLLADAESDLNDPYPTTGARCLLCHQELSPEASQLLHRLWEFLKGEAKRLLAETENKLEACKRALTSLDFSVCETSSAVYAVLLEKAPHLLSEISASIARAKVRQRAALDAIESRTLLPSDLALLLDSPSPKIDALIGEWAHQLEELEKSDPATKIAACSRELSEFEHRRLLGKHFEAIAEYVEQLKWAEAVRKKINSSRHITSKYNDLFEERVTSRYRETFEEFLKKLGRPLRARIATRGQKAAAVKTLELTLPEGAQHAKASPQYVFSEGEKRSVVLADFLTEVALDTASAGIVLDDPVTSLDSEWKETIARLLIEQARERQVIIFTHDLHFLYLLKAAAEMSSVDLQAHWIRCGADGRPGHISLNNSPASEKDYKSPQKATEYCNRAAKANDVGEEEGLLKAGFAALRTTYEVFVLLDVFNNVVGRFDERISIERLREAAIDDKVVETVIAKVGLLSRYIEGHSHSDAFAAASPLSVELLRSEIEVFNELKTHLKDLKKQRAAPAKA